MAKTRIRRTPTVIKPAPEPKRYLSVSDLMDDSPLAARLFGAEATPAEPLITIPRAVYPIPGSAGWQQAYRNAMEAIDVITGTVSTFPDDEPAAWNVSPAIHAPEPIVPQGDINTRECPVIEPPHALGLGELTGSEKAAWRRWWRAIREESGTDEDGEAA